MVNPQKISSYLRKPYELDADAEQAMRGLIKEYPYFNNGWLLLARSLHNQKSPLFNEGLKQASMFAGDRNLLYKLVNIEDAEGEAINERLKTSPPPVTKPIQTTPATEVAATVEKPTTEPVNEVLVSETPLDISFREAELEQPTEEILTAPENPANTENDKIASAYNEIFGNQSSSSQNNISTDFETFEIAHDHITDNEPEFTLSIDEEEESPEYSTAPKSNEETFELEVADRLAKEGIITTPPNIEASEETFELNTLDTIAQENESVKEEASYHLGEENFELEVGNRLDDHSDGIEEVAQANEEEKASVSHHFSEESFELNVADVIASEENNEDQLVISEPEEEHSEIAEPIAFKLGTKEEAPKTEPELQEEESVLMAPATFYEWLTQLKALQNGEEKKTEIVSEPIDENPLVSAQLPEIKYQITPVVEVKPETPAPKSTSVDEIINRFIAINPTISRPKAEFFNPLAKSKESDTPGDDLATETLAKIYRSQKLHDRAIDVYERLIKLHPSKAEEYRSTINEIKHGLDN